MSARVFCAGYVAFACGVTPAERDAVSADALATCKALEIAHAYAAGEAGTVDQ